MGSSLIVAITAWQKCTVMLEVDSSSETCNMFHCLLQILSTGNYTIHVPENS
jgi:hypothetical protein